MIEHYHLIRQNTANCLECGELVTEATGFPNEPPAPRELVPEMTDDFTKGLDNMNHISDGRILATKADLLALHTKAVVATLLKLKEEMKMHTVPEGTDLITRSYLNNSIDFIIAQLSAKEAHE